MEVWGFLICCSFLWVYNTDCKSSGCGNGQLKVYSPETGLTYCCENTSLRPALSGVDAFDVTCGCYTENEYSNLPDDANCY
ncbi:hypothetical protein ElyMa_005866800 [Elysia marginata]|uniref:Uncharacterized protein n=1 Tax=Elysia marginata TaxID=1093978 RepID=A0AAV4G0R4_9GAST|nr:hypothetical protein ElyMa_005866800 [Elysia marginata]